MSFGRYLKAIRLSRGISSAQLAEEIRVTPRQIAVIEDEDFDRMPAEVYTKGILRAYAEAVYLDPDDIVARYQLDREARDEALRMDADIFGAPWKNLLKMALALAVLGVIITVTLYGAEFLEKERSQTDSRPAQNRGENDAGTAKKSSGFNKADNSGQAAAAKQQQHAVPESEILVLSIDALAEARVSIEVDGRRAEHYELDPRDHLELAGTSSFRIRISDPAAVNINFNGRPVEAAAEPGQPARLFLSPEGRESRE